MRIRTTAAIAALALLAACGLKGGLERPPPEFGEARRVYEAEQKAKAEAAAKAQEEKEKARQRTTIPVQPPSSPVSPPQQPQ